MEASKLVKEQDKLDFPYATSFLPSKQKMYQAYLNYQPEIKTQRYRINVYQSQRFFDPPVFKDRNSYVRVKSGVKNYDIIDGLTDLYIEKERVKSTKAYAISALDFWNQEKEKIYQIMKDHGFDPNNSRQLREAVYLGNREPSLFKITWLKGLLQVLGVKGKWLDISAGWGDRLIAAMALGYQYTGFDPNIQLKEGHDQMIKDFGNPSQHQIKYQPFEEALIEKESFDFCLSSPPFFDLEIYSHDKNQSIQKYSAFEDWMVYFFFYSLRKAWDGLKIGGILAIHMDDFSVRIQGQSSLIKQPINNMMNMFIYDYLPGSMYQGVIGLEGQSKTVRPVSVWKKNRQAKKKRKFLLSYPQFQKYIQ